MATVSVIQPCLLANLGAIEVLVIDERDQPVPNVVVVLSDGNQEVSTRTGPNAHVRFAGLVPGSYALTVPEWDQAACIEAGTRELSTARKKGGASVLWKSPIAFAQPPAEVEIKEGDSIPRIAAKFGFLTETVWKFDGNTTLRNKRRAMFARVGETLAIPLRLPRRLSVEVGNFYYLRILGIPWLVRLRFLYEDGKPRAAEPYVMLMQLGNGPDEVTQGQTDEGGFLVEPISPDASLLEITIGRDAAQEVYQIGMREYQPVDEPTGLQMRLSTLGYYGGLIDGDAGPMTSEAVAAFQEDFNLSVTGVAEPAMLTKLEEIFGC